MRYLALVLLLAVAGLHAQSPRTTLEPVAGTDGVGDGGRALAAWLGQVEGVAVDRAGNIYLADAAEHRIRRIDPQGVIDTVAGDGTAGYGGDSGPARRAQLQNPYGVAVDAAGRVYIADLGNARVRRVELDGTIHTVVGGGAVATDVDGSFATDVRLVAPRDVTLDRDGNLYVADFGAHRVYRIAPNGILTVVAGTGRAGLGGDGGVARQALLSFPAGLAVDAAGTLYIADSGNRRIRRVRRGLIATVGSGPRGDLPLPISSPIGVAVDAAGVLTLSDAIQVWRLVEYGALTRLPVVGRGIAFDMAGNLLVASGGGVRLLRASGGVAEVAGVGAGRFAGEGQPAAQARLVRPTRVVADRDGTVYFSDQGGHRVLRVTAAGLLETVVGTGEAGFDGDGGTPTRARLQAPTGLALDGIGNLYIADTGNHRVRKLWRSGVLTTIAGDGEARLAGDGGPGSLGSLQGPMGVAVDPDGAVYIADTGNHAIRRLSPSGYLSTVAGTGRPGYSGDGGPATEARLEGPQAVALDVQGNLHVLDTQNHALRLVTTDGTILTLFDAAPPLWRLPRDLAVAEGGELLIADTGQQRLVQVMRDGAMLETASTVDGLRTAVGVAWAPDGSRLVVDEQRRMILRLRPEPVAVAEP